ncbi:hypothetical protein HY384_01125 [Candidatus Daviesbacteria bacterium]|nr:hypothetical protein [Candidatus Daviesbacteria bacterium]
MAEELKRATAIEQTGDKTSEWLFLYGKIIYNEATSLLAKYLPQAFPQESTEVLFDIQPLYLGKFKGKHYIAIQDTYTSNLDNYLPKKPKILI